MAKFAANCAASKPIALTDDDLDLGYSALRDALEDFVEGKAELFLTMVCLALMARYERVSDVLPLIANVHAQCSAEADEGAQADGNTHEDGSLTT